MKKMLYYCPSAEGGIADYAHEQANRLSDLHVDLTMLAPSDFSPKGPCRYQLKKILRPSASPLTRWPRVIRRVRTALNILINSFRVYKTIMDHSFHHVLFGSYSEYLAPIWAPAFRLLARRKVVFGAILHDPVRDYVVGPLWWHRISIAQGYSFLREAFLHENPEEALFPAEKKIRLTVLPHGPYAFPVPSKDRETVRLSLGIPETGLLFLSFGYLRDNKNLDLFIGAMAGFSDVYLVFAGESQSDSQKPLTFYQQLAETLGVSARCKWVEEFIPPEEVGNFFNAADFMILTYSCSFHSASGVLNTAAYFRKPCLASAGQGNLRSMVQKYQLGVWVEPDDAGELKSGLHRLIHEASVPRWEEYKTANSWELNASLIVEKMFTAPSPS